MRVTHIIPLAASVLFATTLFAAPSPSNNSTEPVRLLKSVAADARQIRAEATEFHNLTKDSSATWAQYDRQWNELQPRVEMLGRKIASLESMESSLTDAQKQDLNQSKADYQKISWQSRQLGKMVDTVPPNLQSQQFKMETRQVVNESTDMVHASKSGA